jgi:hypothetical protein
MPPKQKLKLGDNELQAYRGKWVPPSKMKSIIEGLRVLSMQPASWL